MANRKGNSFSNSPASGTGMGPVPSSPQQATAGSNDQMPASVPSYPS